MRRSMMRALSSLIIVILSLSLALPYQEAKACGYDGPYLLPAEDPADAAHAFADGELGLIAPGWDTSYLLFAYRALRGKPMAPAARQSLFEHWTGVEASAFSEPAWERWVKARFPFSGGSHVATPGLYRSISASHDYYLNCHDDAFETAIATLHDRVARVGKDSAHVREWIAGQDEVFVNCGGGMSIPPRLGKDMPYWLRADRDYQIAAAHFYAGNFETARKLFEVIALDKKSPWRTLAPYLAARAVVREASLRSASPAAQYRDADVRLENILKRPELSTIHQSSHELQALVRARYDPQGQLERLALRFETDSLDASAHQEAIDLQALFGQCTVQPFAPACDQSDLLDWLTTMKSEASDGYARAYGRYTQSGGLHWLVAALTHARAASRDVSRLLEAAAAVAENTPASATLHFHRVRLLAALGHRTKARRLLERTSSLPMPPATRNAFASLGLSLAQTLDEWIRHAPRIENGGSGLVVHADAAARLAQDFSTRMLMQLASAAAAPAALSREIHAAVFVRAIALGDDSAARHAARALQKSAPELATDMEEFLDARPRDRLGVGALIALRHDHAFNEPSIRGAFSGSSQSCSVSIAQLFCDVAGPGYTAIVEQLEIPSQLGSSADREQARRQHRTLQANGTRLDALGKQVELWAQRSPLHPLVPEALHQFVARSRGASMHYTSTPETGRRSKLFFQKLHREYPQSEWRQRTRFWYR